MRGMVRDIWSSLRARAYACMMDMMILRSRFCFAWNIGCICLSKLSEMNMSKINISHIYSFVPQTPRVVIYFRSFLDLPYIRVRCFSKGLLYVPLARLVQLSCTAKTSGSPLTQYAEDCNLSHNLLFDSHLLLA